MRDGKLHQDTSIFDRSCLPPSVVCGCCWGPYVLDYPNSDMQGWPCQGLNDFLDAPVLELEEAQRPQAAKPKKKATGKPTRKGDLDDGLDEPKRKSQFLKRLALW